MAEVDPRAARRRTSRMRERRCRSAIASSDVLAVTYTLLQNWIAETNADTPAAGHPPKPGDNGQTGPPAPPPAR